MDQKEQKYQYYLDVLKQSNIKSREALARNEIPSPPAIENYAEISELFMIGEDNDLRFEFRKEAVIYFALKLVSDIRTSIELNEEIYNQQNTDYIWLKKWLNGDVLRNIVADREFIVNLLEIYNNIAKIKRFLSECTDPFSILSYDETEKTFLALKEQFTNNERLHNNSDIGKDIRKLGLNLLFFVPKIGIKLAEELPHDLTLDNFERIIEEKFKEIVSKLVINEADLSQDKYNELLNLEQKAFCWSILEDAKEIIEKNNIQYGKEKNILNKAYALPAFLANKNWQISIGPYTYNLKTYLTTEEREKIKQKLIELQDFNPALYEPEQIITPEQKQVGNLKPSSYKKAFIAGSIVLGSGILITPTPILAALISNKLYADTPFSTTILNNIGITIGVGIAISITAAVITTIALSVAKNEQQIN